MNTKRFLAALFTLSLAACGGGTEPDPDPNANEQQQQIDPTFANVYAEVITPNCSCHTTGAGGLAMPDANAAFTALVDIPATTGGPCDGETRVISGDAQGSVLYRKLSGTNLCGSAMPMGGGSLSADQLALVEAWIGAGAVNN
ncbi:MAG: hypothetical protein RL846_10400 [Deltaproteobacteria bacterium]